MTTPDLYASLFVAYLQRKGIGGLTCSVCGSKGWSVTPPVTQLGYEEGSIQLGGYSMPVLPVICRNCKHVVNFAWLPIQRGE